MPPSDTSERGLENLIVAAMVGKPAPAPAPAPGPAGAVNEPTALYGGTGWLLGDWHDYDRDHALDLVQLAAFLRATQPKVAESLDLDQDGPTRRKFLARLQGEVTKRGTVDVLRHGIKHGAHELQLFYGTPTRGNPKAEERFAQNRFSVTRQLRFSRDETQLALDLCLFVNGLPVITFELKNSLTKQTVADAVEQYRRDRDRRELLLQLGAASAHFAGQETRCASAPPARKASCLPFDHWWNDGAGNGPPRWLNRYL